MEKSNEYRSKVYTLKECVVEFQDSLHEILPVKIKELNHEYEVLSGLYRLRVNDLKDRTSPALKAHNIPQEEWSVYWAFVSGFDWTLIRRKEKLAEVITELDNVLNAYNILTSLKEPNKFEELDIDGAKEYPIQSLYYGELKKAGRLFKGKCPFHQEDSPSFFVYPNNTFHCFGCQEHGSSIDFVMKLEGISFVDAVRRLV